MEKKMSMLYGIFLVMLTGGVLGYLYRLKLPYAIMLVTIGGVLLPVWIRERKKRIQEEKRFLDANRYIEQVLYSFRKSPQILSALMDVEKLFEKGSMSNCIKRAITYIKETYEGEEISKEALKMIEKEYPMQRVKNVHRLMLKVERLGGSCEESVRILLKNRDTWEKETISYQKHCQMEKRNIVIAILLSSVLCLMTPILCQTSLKDISILDNTVYQIGTLLMLLSGMLVYIFTEKYFSGNLFLEKDYISGEIILKKYEKIMHYNASKERKKSFLWGALTLGLIISFAIFGKWKFSIIFVPIFIFMLFQHRLDYLLAKKAVIHEIRKAFPDWLMEVALLLQTENVPNSIRKSIANAPEILKPELNLLLEKLAVNPESNLPYCEFFQKFSIPEVSSAMGMLYSISDGSGADAKIQIEEILERNMKWQSEAETMKNKDKVGKMYLLFLLPALIGALKLVVDMTLILFAFFAGISG